MQDTLLEEDDLRPVFRPRPLAWGPSQSIPIQDDEWIEKVRQQFGFVDLDISRGQFVWNMGSGTHFGGRCWHRGYGDTDHRTWLIELSYKRLNLEGRNGMENILAHEMLHAWLFQLAGRAGVGHGKFFMAIAETRGIDRHCDSFWMLERRTDPQMAMDLV
jgi:hypothetical protein